VRVQARNNADQLVYSAEKNIDDFKDKVSTEIVDSIKAAIAE
jgi:molecular chaperone DnaK (HSP70)